jgi:hypothetical protein
MMAYNTTVESYSLNSAAEMPMVPPLDVLRDSIVKAMEQRKRQMNNLEDQAAQLQEQARLIRVELSQLDRAYQGLSDNPSPMVG